MAALSIESKTVKSNIILHGGGKHENKVPLQQPIMGGQKLDADLVVESGALYGCLIIIAVHNEKVNEQYFFHLNLHGTNDSIWAKSEKVALESSKILEDDKENYSFYLIYTRASMTEYYIRDEQEFIERMSMGFGIPRENPQDKKGLRLVDGLTFSQTIRVDHFGQRLYISYSSNGVLHFQDSSDATASFELTLPRSMPGLVKLKNYLRSLCDNTATKVHYSEHMNRLLNCPDKGNMALLGGKFSKRRSWSLGSHSPNHKVFQCVAQLSDDISFDEVIRTLQAPKKSRANSNATPPSFRKSKLDR